MSNLPLSWGAKALVYLKYNGDLKDLCSAINKPLELPEFYIRNDPDPPHDYLALGGALGFHITIYKSIFDDNYLYEIEIDTEDCLDEVMEHRMHDISIWFGKYVSKFCKIDTLVYDKANKLKVYIFNGEISPQTL